MMSFHFRIFSMLLGLFTCVDHQMISLPIDIEIVTPTYFGVDSLISLQFLQPAYKTGLQLLRNTYPEFDITHRFLTDINATNCLIQQGNVQDILGRWYYLESRNTSIKLIVTPGCLEAEYINQLARAWNILFYTATFSTETVRRKDISPTWITNAAIPTSLGDVIKSLLLRYNWTSVVVITDIKSAPAFQNLAKAVSITLKQANFRLNTWTLTSGGTDSDELNLMLSGIRDNCRVVMFCGPSPSFRRFLLAASNQNMTNGEYAFIAALPFDHKLFGKFTWNTSENSQENEVVRLAYRSVLLLKGIYQGENETDRVKQLLPKWQNLSAPAITELLPIPYLTCVHTVFQIIGQAISGLMKTPNNSLFDLMNGTRLAGEFLNRTFLVDTGAITISSTGSRLTNVCAQQFQNETNDLQTFLIGSEDMSGVLDWTNIQPESWFGGAIFPQNEPACGYRGDAVYCQKGQKSILWTTVGCALIILCVTAVVILIIYQKLRLMREDDAWWVLEFSLLGPALRHYGGFGSIIQDQFSSAT